MLQDIDLSDARLGKSHLRLVYFDLLNCHDLAAGLVPRGVNYAVGSLTHHGNFLELTNTSAVYEDFSLAAFNLGFF